MTTDIKSSKLQDTADQNVETGVWLLCKEFLVTAIQDKRLERGHLRVLASIVTLINHRTAKAWPDRTTIASMAGMSVSAVSNALSELRKWEYLIVDREYVEAAGGRKLMVYTFGNIDHETIRSEITKFVERLQRDRSEGVESKVVAAHISSSSPPTVNLTSPPTVNFTAYGERISPPTVNNSSPPTVNKQVSSPPTVDKSSPPTVDSNYREGTINKTSAKKVVNAPARQGDLLEQVGDPPPVVEFKMWKTAVAFKPAGHSKFEVVHDTWILRHVENDDLPLARQFIASEIEQFFMEPKFDKDGKQIRLMGFLTSGFQYRWPNYKKRMASKFVLSAENSVADEWAAVGQGMRERNDD